MTCTEEYKEHIEYTFQSGLSYPYPEAHSVLPALPLSQPVLFPAGMKCYNKVVTEVANKIY